MTSLKDSRINLKDKRKAKKQGWEALPMIIDVEITMKDCNIENELPNNDKTSKKDSKKIIKKKV